MDDVAETDAKTVLKPAQSKVKKNSIINKMRKELQQIYNIQPRKLQI